MSDTWPWVKSFEVIDEKYIKRIQHSPVFELHPGLNVLVGPNGSGKSTFIETLTKNSVRVVKSEQKPHAGTMFFDTEKHNPRISKTFSGPNGCDATMATIATRWCSHGQAISAIMQALGQAEAGRLIIVDEPESGMDVSGVGLFLEKAASVTSRGHQMIIASHHIAIWAAADRIIKFGPPEYIEEVVGMMSDACKKLIDTP